MNFVANVPHIRCFVKKEYVHDLERGHGEYIEAVLIAVKSMRGKALMFEAYLPEYGACFDKFPISALVWRKNIINSEQLNLNQLELWDAFSYHIQIWEKSLLKNCNVKIWIPDKGEMKGEYLFTIDSVHSDPNTINTGVSEVPTEHKQFNFGKLENGQYFAQPNNRMLWYEQSLTPKELKKPDFKVCGRYYYCEQEEQWRYGDSDDYFYKGEKVKDE